MSAPTISPTEVEPTELDKILAGIESAEAPPCEWKHITHNACDHSAEWVLSLTCAKHGPAGRFLLCGGHKEDLQKILKVVGPVTRIFARCRYSITDCERLS